jgi:hypothetical protein
MAPCDRQSEVQLLLYDLCVDLGFCLPPREHRRLRDAPPADANSFADAVFAAEGMDPGSQRELWGQVRETVDRHMRGWADPAEREPAD